MYDPAVRKEEEAVVARTVVAPEEDGAPPPPPPLAVPAVPPPPRPTALRDAPPPGADLVRAFGGWPPPAALVALAPLSLAAAAEVAEEEGAAPMGNEDTVQDEDPVAGAAMGRASREVGSEMSGGAGLAATEG